MNTANYRLIVRANNPDGKAEYKMHFDQCHEAKVEAGRLFHRDEVQAVVVADIEGTPYLYLRKGCPDKTIDVSSKLAKFG
jgi:hypothetical protein